MAARNDAVHPEMRADSDADPPLPSRIPAFQCVMCGDESCI